MENFPSLPVWNRNRNFSNLAVVAVVVVGCQGGEEDVQGEVVGGRHPHPPHALPSPELPVLPPQVTVHWTFKCNDFLFQHLHKLTTKNWG